MNCPVSCLAATAARSRGRVAPAFCCMRELSRRAAYVVTRHRTRTFEYARHGRWIGGESPQKEEVELTPSPRQLSRREAGWEGSPPEAKPCTEEHEPCKRRWLPGWSKIWSTVVVTLRDQGRNVGLQSSVKPVSENFLMLS